MNKDENIGFYGYISWILRIYWDTSRNINENFDKKYQWMKIDQTHKNIEENCKKW